MTIDEVDVAADRLLEKFEDAEFRMLLRHLSSGALAAGDRRQGVMEVLGEVEDHLFATRRDLLPDSRTA